MAELIQNWAGNESWTPGSLVTPNSLDELMALITKARAESKRLKPVGSMHSFSRAAATDAIQVDMKKLNRILSINLEKKTIEAEAGILLSELYRAMKGANLALPSIPNTEDITLGGAVVNVTHGTNQRYGSFSSLVLKLLLLSADGKLLTLKRDPQDPLMTKRFEAAITSFGSLGIIYSIELQLVENYDVLVQKSVWPLEDVLPKISQLAEATDAVQFILFQEQKMAFMKIQTKLPYGVHQRFSPSWRENMSLDLLLWALNPKRNRKFSQLFQYLMQWQLFIRCLKWFYHSTAITQWCDGELSRHPSRFVNMEYALPLARIQEAVNQIFAITNKHKQRGSYTRSFPLILRPVGADSYGLLSSALGRKTCYIDMIFQTLDEDEVDYYKEVEQALLDLDGRVSWSRKFFASSQQILKNYPKAEDFYEVLQDLDPQGVFSNDFTLRVFESLVKNNS